MSADVLTEQLPGWSLTFAGRTRLGRLPDHEDRVRKCSAEVTWYPDDGRAELRLNPAADGLPYYTPDEAVRCIRPHIMRWMREGTLNPSRPSRFHDDVTAAADAMTAAAEHPAWCARHRCVIPGAYEAEHRGEVVEWTPGGESFRLSVQRVSYCDDDGCEDWAEVTLTGGRRLVGTLDDLRELGRYLTDL